MPRAQQPVPIDMGGHTQIPMYSRIRHSPSVACRAATIRLQLWKNDLNVFLVPDNLRFCDLKYVFCC